MSETTMVVKCIESLRFSNVTIKTKILKNLHKSVVLEVVRILEILPKIYFDPPQNSRNNHLILRNEET